VFGHLACIFGMYVDSAELIVSSLRRNLHIRRSLFCFAAVVLFLEVATYVCGSIFAVYIDSLS